LHYFFDIHKICIKFGYLIRLISFVTDITKLNILLRIIKYFKENYYFYSKKIHHDLEYQTVIFQRYFLC
jgi:hypothetical protein